MSLRAISQNDQVQLGVADYVWLDKAGDFHSKNRVIEVFGGVPRIERWSGVFPTPDEEVILSPCYYVPDPFRPQPCYVVLCEVRDVQDVAHASNERATLRKLLDQKLPGPLVGFRQKYELGQLRGGDDYKVAEKQMGACVDSGIMLNSVGYYEELPDWWFQISPRKVGTDETLEKPQLAICDHLVIARYFMIRATTEVDTPLTWNGGTALIYPDKADPAVMADHLRQKGHDINLRASGLEMALSLATFDPYKVVCEIHIDTVQLEQEQDA